MTSRIRFPPRVADDNIVIGRSRWQVGRWNESHSIPPWTRSTPISTNAGCDLLDVTTVRRTGRGGGWPRGRILGCG